MTERKNNPGGEAADELVITRVFDAPRELVFEAFTDPKHGLHWMGPRDYPIVKMEGELKPGGKWRSCLRAKDSGEELWNGGVYREVVAPERLVYTFAWDEESGNTPTETLVTLTFEDENGKTKMTFRQAPFASTESRDGHNEGWNSSFDRLDDYLSEIAPAK